MSFLNRFHPERPLDDLRHSVLRNLEHLLSSRHSYGSLLCSFGIGDYLGQAGGGAAVKVLLREIYDTIALYEPRLRVLSLHAIGRDAELRLHVELRGMLLGPLFSVSAQAAPSRRPGTPALAKSSSAAPAENPTLSSLQPLLNQATEDGLASFLTSNPQAAPALVALGLAADAGLLPPEMVRSAQEAAQVALTSSPGLAAALAVAGFAARAGLLPPTLSAAAALAGQAATSSDSELAASAALASALTQAGVLPPHAQLALAQTSGTIDAGSNPGITAMRAMASLAAQSGQLPTASAEGLAHSPSAALTSDPALAGAISVATMASQLGVGQSKSASLATASLATTRVAAQPALSATCHLRLMFTPLTGAVAIEVINDP